MKGNTKLSIKVLRGLSILLPLLLAAWAIVFYYVVVNEVNDETDDALEDYSTRVMRNALSGTRPDSLAIPYPDRYNGSNNSYHITPISAAVAKVIPPIQYKDSLVYIPDKHETEPARVLKSVYKDRQGYYYQLTVSTPSYEKIELFRAILVWIVILCLILLVSVIIVVQLIFYRNVRPLYGLLHWLDQYKIGGTNQPLDNPSDIREFSRLNQAVADYTYRAEEAFDQQKQFISNASHEIQTPLAICKNRLEMLMDSPSLAEAQLEELAKTHQTLDHISKLNRSLLFLSKIDNRQFPEESLIDFSVLAHRLVDDFDRAYSFKDLKVTLQEKGPLHVSMNDQLATALVTNLLKNAYVHTPTKGAITLFIQPDSFTICNSSQGEALDDQRIFDRFYKGNEAGSGSSGLGLAIVQAIARLYHFKLTYSFANNVHYFTILFFISE